MSVFKGWHERNIDDKGRLSIPSRFREVLEGSSGANPQVTVTVGKDGCLDVYPFHVWRTLEESIAKAPRFNPSMINFRRAYVSPAQDCPIDKNGRIIIPQVLRKIAGLDRDVMIVGQVEIFEIWDVDRWNAALAQSQTEIDWSQISQLGL